MFAYFYKSQKYFNSRQDIFNICIVRLAKYGLSLNINVCFYTIFENGYNRVVTFALTKIINFVYSRYM